jgi:hypothetical protein
MFRKPKPRRTTQVTKVGEGCHSSTQFWYTFRFNVRLRKVLAAKVTDDLLYQTGGRISIPKLRQAMRSISDGI